MGKIDLTSHYTAYIHGSCKQVMEYEDKTQPRTDSQGRFIYEVTCMAIPVPLFGEVQEPESDFAVQIAATENPCKGFKPGIPVTFESLTLEFGKYNGKYWVRRASGIAKA